MLDEYVNKIESEFKQNDNLIKKCKAKIHELNLYNLDISDFSVVAPDCNGKI